MVIGLNEEYILDVSVIFVRNNKIELVASVEEDVSSYYPSSYITKIVDVVLDYADLEDYMIDNIILEGEKIGMYIYNLMTDKFDVDISVEINPKKAALYGACTYAYCCQGDVKELFQLTVWDTAIVDLIYSPISNKRKTHINGKIMNFNEIDANEIEIEVFMSKDSSASCWSSGRRSLDRNKKGVFDIEINLFDRLDNFVYVSIYNSDGKRIPIQTSRYLPSKDYDNKTCIKIKYDWRALSHEGRTF